MRRKLILISVLILLILFAIAPIIPLSVSADDEGEESKVEITEELPAAVVFTETFEGAFPGTAWSVGDWDAANGLDYWDDTNYKAHAGSWSGWCADIGTQAVTETIWSETFEGSFPGTSWVVGDWDGVSGSDYWDDTNYRAHAGSWSGWCAQVGAQATKTTIFTETFEGAFPGTTWTVGDWDATNGLDYWDDTSVRAHSGSWSGWCNDYPDPSATNYDDYMHAYMYRAIPVSLSGYSSVYLTYYYYLRCETNYDYLQVMYYSGGTWYYVDTHTGDLGTSWYSSTASIPTTATYVGFFFYSDNVYASYEGAYVDDVILTGVRQEANSILHKYDLNMDAYMYRAVDLSSYASATLSYYYWIVSESGFDTLRVMYQSGGTWYYTDLHSGNSGGWQYSSVSIPITATNVGFYFLSDSSFANYEGAYLDDITLTGNVPTYSVTINAYCNTEGASVSVPITKDGVPSGFNTPYTFTGLTGTHTFRVPTKDAMGHHFKQWSTGSTNTEITVSGAGTYTAYYETPSFDIWTSKTSYVKGETMQVFVQVRNMGPATPVKALIWLQLPNGFQYGPLLDTTVTLPANFNSGNYLWNSFQIPTSAPSGTYTWISELRNPSNNALIDLDTHVWTLT